MDDTREFLLLCLAIVTVGLLLVYFNLWRFGVGISPREKKRIERSIRKDQHYNNLRILEQERHQDREFNFNEPPCVTCEDRDGGIEGDTFWKCLICEKIEKWEKDQK